MCKLPKLSTEFWQISRAKCFSAFGYSTGLRYGTCTRQQLRRHQPNALRLLMLLITPFPLN
jgi:hypothetical protein